jgi:DNA-binding transcriptional LysR family regulator
MGKLRRNYAADPEMTRASRRKTALPTDAGEPVSVTPANLDDDLMISRAIVRLFEVRSFSAVARSLGVSVSAVTRSLTRHEQRLGVALFLRSTHGITPTAAGRRYAEHLTRWLQEEDVMRASLNAERRAESGSLRITVPVFVAEQLLTDALRAFRESHPLVSVDVHASDDIRDLIKEGFDLAIRQGPLTASNLRTRKIADFRRWVVAAPSLLGDREHPRDPRALREYPCLLYGGGLQEQKWEFWSPSGELIELPVTSMLRSNNLELLMQLCCAGLGLVRLPDGVVAGAIARGKLVQLCPDYTCTAPETRPTLHAVHAKDPGKDRLREAFLNVLQETARARMEQLARTA